MSHRFLPSFRFICVVLLAAVAASRASAQAVVARGGIEGTVIDSATGAPRLGVAVTIGNSTRGALTDANGRFAIPDLAPGTYTIHTHQLSTRSVEQVVVVRAGATTSVILTLANAPHTLGAVRASAKAPERDRFELSPNTSAISITGNTSKSIPALGEPDVLRAVQLLPGVNARNDFSSGFNVRGGEADQNLILLDGYPIYNPFHLGGLFSTFLSETVGQIDLLTGGFPAEYGGRLSSILDVTSAEPDRTGLHGTADVSVISSSLSIGSASADGRSSWVLSGRRTYADKLVAAISDKSFPYHFSDGEFHGVRALGSGNLRLEVTGYAGSDDLDGDFATLNDSSPSSLGGGTFKFGWQNQLIGTSLRDVWRDSVHVPLIGVADSINVEQHVSFTRFGTGLNLGAGAVMLTNSVQELRVAGDAQWARGSHQRKLGYEISGYSIHYDVQSTTSPAELFDLAQHPTASALFYEEQWKPSRKWIADVGLRAEHLTGRDWTGLEPRASVKYFVTPDLALSASVGDYAQWLHSLNREDIPIRIFDFWVASDSYTPVSKARHYILGMERWLGPLRFARVEGWVKQYDNLLEQNTADDPAIRGDEFLVSKGVSYGVDVLFRQLEIGPFGGWLAYTYGVSARTRDTVSYWPGQDRRHNLNIVATYKPGTHYTFSARLGLATGTPYTDIVGQLVRRAYNPETGQFDGTGSIFEPVGGAHNAERYPLFQRLDLGVSRTSEWRGMTLTPYLSVINAYDAQNVFIYTFDYTHNPPTRQAISQFPFLPSIGLTMAF